MPTTAEINAAAANFIADTETADAKINGAPATVTDRHGVTTPNLEQIFANIGYRPPVDYVPGLSPTTGAFTVIYNGVVYGANPSEIPFTTTEAFDTNQWFAVAGRVNESWVFAAKEYNLPGHPGQQANLDRNVFGFTALSPTTGRIFVIYRKGQYSEASVGSVYMQYSDDNGDTWTAEAEQFAEASVNLTNLGGGCAENGNLVVFYVRYTPVFPSGPHTFLSVNYRVSTDGGATWGAEQTIDTTGVDLFSPYGKADVLDNGDMVQCWYHQSPSYAVKVIKSTDDGVTWSALATLPLTGGVTETDILSLGNGRLVTVSRVDGGSHYKMCTSDDSGATWTYRGEVKQITFTNISPPWLEKFTDSFGRTVVAMYYYQRDKATGEKPLRVIYAYADDIMSEGVTAFKTRSDRAIFSDGTGIGYPSAVHPFDDALGIGWTIENDDVRFFHSLESTPWGAHWQGRRLGIGGDPGDQHLFVKGRAAIGEGTQAGEAPQNGLMVQGQIGAGITDTVGSLPAAVVGRSATEQARLEYSASVYASFYANNLGYLGIVPTGKRVGIGTLSPVRTLHVHEQSTGPVRVKLTNDTSGLYGGAEFYFASGVFYLTNADTGGITLASGPVNVTPAEVSMANLPTSDPAVAGRLWNDAGTVKISAG